MDVATLNSSITRENAKVALLEYKACREKHTKIDKEIERLYRAIARGRKVISVAAAIEQAGADSEGHPKLAIGRADAIEISYYLPGQEIEYYDRGWAKWKFRCPCPGAKYSGGKGAIVPHIPPHLRPPQKSLVNYWILWEADWKALPRDPILLQRIGGDAWVVLAAWELTEVELSVLRNNRER